MDHLLNRLCAAGRCTWAELRDGLYSWDDIWIMHDMLDLSDWLEWQHHSIANKGAQ